MHGHVLGLDGLAVGHPAAAELLGVGGEDLGPGAPEGHADAVVLPLYRHEVAHRHQLPAVLGLPAEGDDALLVVVVGDPLEALPGEVDLPQLGPGQVEVVHRLEEGLGPLVLLVLEQAPLQFLLEVPLVLLGEFRAHELQLLAGVGHHVGDEGPHLVGLHLVVPWHFIEERALPVHHLVVRDGQDEVLGEGVEEGEGQGVVVPAAEVGVQGHVGEHVVHPAHVPLVVKAQAAQEGGLAHHGPGGGLLGDHHAVGGLGEGGLVQGLQEGHGLVVLLAPVLVGNPLPVPAVVVQVQHRGHRVHPQAVHVVLLQPEHGAGHQKALHLGPAVVEHQGAPLFVLSLSGVLILVAGGAVELGQARRVPGEVGGDPVHNHPDARLVAPVDEAHKVVGGAVPGGGGEIARHLVAPRGVEGVLRQGHELNMGKAHLFHVGDELVPQLLVREDAAVLVLPPRARVDLVDVHRLLVVGVLPLVLQPLLVVPLVALQVVPPGGGAGAGLGVAGVGIGLVGVLPLGGLDVKLVHLVGLELKVGVAFPDLVVDLLQGVLGLVPVAEIPHQRHLSGPGGPHPGHHAGLSVPGGLVHAHVLVRPAVLAASEQVKWDVFRLVFSGSHAGIHLGIHRFLAPFPSISGLY